MECRIKDLQDDPSWVLSVGEKLGMIHYRKGHWHAECDPQTGICNIHYDKHDPHESPTSLVKHMSESKLGSATLIGVGLLAIDHIFNDGKIRKKIKKYLFD